MKLIFTVLLTLCLISCSTKFSSIVSIKYEETIEEKIARKVVSAVLHDTDTNEKKFHVRLVTEEWKEKCLKKGSIIPSKWCPADYWVSGVYKYGVESWGVIESCDSDNGCTYNVLFYSALEE